MRNNSLEYYFGLKYPIRLIPYGDGSYFADIPDLPGCMTEGDSLEETIEMIEDAKRAWLEVALESGKNIPIPSTEKEYSGKLVLRISKTLHSSLSEKAEEEGVSLIQREMEDNYRYYQYYFQCYCGKCFWNHEELMKHQTNEHNWRHYVNIATS